MKVRPPNLQIPMHNEEWFNFRKKGSLGVSENFWGIPLASSHHPKLTSLFTQLTSHIPHPAWIEDRRNMKSSFSFSLVLPNSSWRLPPPFSFQKTRLTSPDPQPVAPRIYPQCFSVNTHPKMGGDFPLLCYKIPEGRNLKLTFTKGQSLTFSRQKKRVLAKVVKNELFLFSTWARFVVKCWLWVGRQLGILIVRFATLRCLEKSSKDVLPNAMVQSRKSP